MFHNNIDPLRAVNSCGILDGASAAAFCALVDCASRVLDVPICYIALIDDKDLSLASAIGTEAIDMERGSALCRHVMMSEGVFVIEDASVDARFCDNPLATGSPGVRFFAAAPLKGTAGQILGGLCIGDRAPRTISTTQRATLQDLAVIATALVENDKAAARALQSADGQRQRADVQSRDLKLRERQVLKTERIAKIGSWEFVPATGLSVWSDELYRICGYPIGTAMTVEMGLALCPLPDRSRIQGLFERLLTQGIGYDGEFEIVTPAGERKWTRVCAEAEILDGAIQRLFGTTQDITQQREAECDLKRHERRFQQTEQLAKTGGWQVELATAKCQLSEELYRIYEIPSGTLVTIDFGLSIYHEQARARLVSLLDRAARDGTGFDEEFELRLPSGAIKWTRTIAEVEVIDGVSVRMVGITQDVTQLREAERALKLRERQFLRTEQLAKVGGWEFELATGTTLWSDGLYRIYGFPIGAEMPRETLMNMYGASDQARIIMLIDQLYTGEIADFDEELEAILPTGERKWTRICAEPERVDGTVTRLFGIAQDITERRAAERELWREANHDALTGLANRTQFADRIGALFAKRGTGTPAPGEGLGLLMIDVDRLKETNDTLGHAAGDALLQTVAERLSRAVGDEGRVARIGGDEFVVTLDGVVSSARLAELGKAIVSSMQPKLQRDGHTLSPQVSIGGALALDGDTAEILRQKADLALYECKKARRGSYIEFRDDLRAGILHRIGTVRSVDEALTEGRILPYYQPLVALQTGAIGSFEALARLRMPDGRIVSAGAFHEALEEHRIAYRLTGQMLAQISADIRCWLDAGLPLSRVGINVTSADLQAGDFRTRLTAAFSRYGIPLTHATVEVTEMVFMTGNEAAVIRDLETLRGDGVLVALDDFGTGHASLTHLRTLPVDVLKIDKSFVNGMMIDKTSEPIIEALSSLARKLGLRIVVEGIETTAQAERLRALGCECGQGFLFARPYPANVAADFLSRFGKRATLDAQPSASMRVTG